MGARKATMERPPWTVVIGLNVFRLRTARGWSQEKLARRADLSSDTIRTIENGRNPANENAVRIDTLEAITDGLSLEGGIVEPPDLFEWNEETSRVKLPGNRPRPSVIPGGGDSGQKTYVDRPLLVARG